jgi:polysaccharide pyruvyl transferase WcaK-like protein
MKKNIFILGSYHGNNLGDLEILDTIIGRLYKDYSITILTKSKFKVKYKLASQYFENNNINFVHPYNIFRFLWKLIRSDFVLIGGGGLFFSNNVLDTLRIAGKSQLLYWIKTTILAKLLGKKVFWFGVGMGPLDGFGKFLTSIGSKFVTKAYLRDEYSYKLMSELTNLEKLELISDVVFSKQEPRKVKKLFEKSNSDLKNLLLIVFEKDNLQKIKALISQLLTKGIKVTLATTNPEKDNKFNKKLSKEFSTNFIDTSNMNLTEFRNMFNKFDLIISMRMHALLISYQQGTPGIGICDELPKVTEIQKQLYGKDISSNDYKLIETSIPDLKSYEANFKLAETGFEKLLKELK